MKHPDNTHTVEVQMSKAPLLGHWETVLEIQVPHHVDTQQQAIQQARSMIHHVINTQARWGHAAGARIIVNGHMINNMSFNTGN